jgi:hypothetical protein
MEAKNILGKFPGKLKIQNFNIPAILQIFRHIVAVKFHLQSTLIPQQSKLKWFRPRQT